MDFQKNLIILFSVLSVIILSVILFFKLFDFWSLLGVLLYATIYVGAIIFVSYTKYLNSLTNETVENQKERFEYSFNRVNTLLSNRPGGEPLEWNSAQDIWSEMKTYMDKNGNEYKFRAFLGYTAIKKIYLLLIYDVDKEDIIKIKPNPRPDEINNIWVDFSPFEKQESNFFNNERFYDRRYKPQLESSSSYNDTSSQSPDDEYERYIRKANTSLQS